MVKIIIYNYCEFQSLFLWKYVSGKARTISCHTSSLFQSLFLWKYVSGILSALTVKSAVQVSILVFVGVRLRYLKAQALNKKMHRFNPCFCGSTSQVTVSVSPDTHLYCFNPCFCGSTSQVLAGSQREPNRTRFQSLFLWKYVSGR